MYVVSYNRRITGMEFRLKSARHRVRGLQKVEWIKRRGRLGRQLRAKETKNHQRLHRVSPVAYQWELLGGKGSSRIQAKEYVEPMHATRKLVFPSGPIDVTGTFQVESEAISNAGRFLFCAIPHLEIHAEHMEFDALLPHSKSMWTSKERQPEKGSARPWFRWKDFQTTHPLTLGSSKWRKLLFSLVLCFVVKVRSCGNLASCS